MAVDHDVREADSGAEDVKEPSRPPDRQSPRDDPGAEAEGIASRADSRAGANAANETSGRSGITESSESAGEAAADATERSLPAGEHGHDGSGERPRSSDRQRALGEHLAEVADQKVDQEIDQTLDKVNPQFDRAKSAYSENCTGVVQANELRRRGFEVEAGPLEKHLRTDEGGPGGRLLEVIEDPWSRSFTPGTKTEIEEAFEEPGSRGAVYIAWNGPGGGGHVFNVENVGGKVRFVDGQPTPSVSDASHYFALGHDTRYVRFDDVSTPPESATQPYLEP